MSLSFAENTTPRCFHFEYDPLASTPTRVLTSVRDQQAVKQTLGSSEAEAACCSARKAGTPGALRCSPGQQQAVHRPTKLSRARELAKKCELTHIKANESPSKKPWVVANWPGRVRCHCFVNADQHGCRPARSGSATPVPLLDPCSSGHVTRKCTPQFQLQVPPDVSPTPLTCAPARDAPAAGQPILPFYNNDACWNKACEEVCLSPSRYIPKTPKWADAETRDAARALRRLRFLCKQSPRVCSKTCACARSQ